MNEVICGSLFFCLWIIYEFLYCYNLSLENFFEVTFLTFFRWPTEIISSLFGLKPLRIIRGGDGSTIAWPIPGALAHHVARPSCRWTNISRLWPTGDHQIIQVDAGHGCRVCLQTPEQSQVYGEWVGALVFCLGLRMAGWQVELQTNFGFNRMLSRPHLGSFLEPQSK